MKWQILAIGKPALSYAREGIALYQQRLAPLCSLQVHHKPKDEGKVANGAAQLKQCQTGVSVALDERGQCLDTRQWLQQVNNFELRGVKQINLLVGGADGHSDDTRAKCDQIWSLAKLTMQHELALLVLLEQIYRIYAIKSGHPYHR